MDEASPTALTGGDASRAGRLTGAGPTRRARAQGGRPHEVRVTYSDAEFAVVVAAAQRAGLAVASWVGDAAVRAGHRPEQQPVAGWGAVMQGLMMPRQELMAVRGLLRNIGVNLNTVAATANSTGALAPQALAVVQVAERTVGKFDEALAQLAVVVERLDAAIVEARQRQLGGGGS